ncbi:MAG TPA: hypothetical protein PLA85_02305 [Micropepsaceae bacterium]|nr:hypothetical protein [Micropepsaceae bacterium]
MRIVPSCLLLMAAMFALFACADDKGSCMGSPGTQYGCPESNPAATVVLFGSAALAGDGNGLSASEERALNERQAQSAATMERICATIETRMRDMAALKPDAAAVLDAAGALGPDTMRQRFMACTGFHAEAAGDFTFAWRMYFYAAMNSLWQREGEAERGQDPEGDLGDALHYGVLDAILRLRAAGHDSGLYYVGKERLDNLTCAQLRREAPQYTQCE